MTREAGAFGTVFIVFERAGDRLLADELIEFAPFDGDGEGEGASWAWRSDRYLE